MSGWHVTIMIDLLRRLKLPSTAQVSTKEKRVTIMIDLLRRLKQNVAVTSVSRTHRSQL